MAAVIGPDIETIIASALGPGGMQLGAYLHIWIKLLEKIEVDTVAGGQTGMSRQAIFATGIDLNAVIPGDIVQTSGQGDDLFFRWDYQLEFAGNRGLLEPTFDLFIDIQKADVTTLDGVLESFGQAGKSRFALGERRQVGKDEGIKAPENAGFAILRCKEGGGSSGDRLVGYSGLQKLFGATGPTVDGEVK